MKLHEGGAGPNRVRHNGGMAEPLSAAVLLRRGIHRRCPVCGCAKIFRRWVRMAESCPRCGLYFRRVDGQWLGSWFLNMCLVQVLVLGIVLGGVVATWPTPPFGVIAAAGVVAAMGFPVWFFPYSRTIWLAIDLAMRPLEFDEGVDPQWELAADLARLRDEP